MADDRTDGGFDTPRSGGDRRGDDRRQEDRRLGEVVVEKDRRSGFDRRSGAERRGGVERRDPKDD